MNLKYVEFEGWVYPLSGYLYNGKMGDELFLFVKDGSRSSYILEKGKKRVQANSKGFKISLAKLKKKLENKKRYMFYIEAKEKKQSNITINFFNAWSYEKDNALKMIDLQVERIERERRRQRRRNELMDSYHEKAEEIIKTVYELKKITDYDKILSDELPKLLQIEKVLKNGYFAINIHDKMKRKSLQTRKAMAKEKLDEVKVKIKEELDSNPKISVKDLAVKLSVSREYIYKHKLHEFINEMR